MDKFLQLKGDIFMVNVCVVLKPYQGESVKVTRKVLFYLQDANHAYSDEELLRRKVQSIMECFLESVTSPTLQVSPF